MIRFEDDSVRYFTVHEAKLLQLFRLIFRYLEHGVKRCGRLVNAVPVKLARFWVII